jgi:thioredoxin-dependent peroxiredoxin
MTATLKSLALALIASLLAAAPAVAEPTLGQPAPGFRLQDQNGKWHALEDYKGQWVVLYFYPKDNTPGCTTQACGFRDNIFAFRDVGAVILGVSIDDVASHRKFAEEHGLPFTILADADKKVATDYGVLTKFLGMMELARRDTFIIDPAGKVARHFEKVDPDGHSQFVLAELKKLGAKKKAAKAG